jgi:hypothetical protein
MQVTANGKTFEFPDGTSTDDIGSAIDEYFAGQSIPATQEPQSADSQAQPQPTDVPVQPPTPKEPSILDSAEQAARGLVNIPFDILQGGASLINAGSRAVGGGDILDPIYRPVDRPTDKFAQAGEAIGGYMVPGAGIAGNIAIGSLAESANQKGDFVQNAATNAAINLGAQGVLSTAAKVIGRGATALKGSISPENQALLSQAERVNVPVMTSDVIPATNAFTRGLQQGGEGAILGTGAARAEQYASRSKVVENYLNKFGEYNPDDVVKSLTKTLGGRRTAAGSVIEDVTQRMGRAPVQTTNTVSVIDANIAKLERLGKTADQKLLNNLKDLRGELVKPDIDFGLLRQQRTAFRTNVQGDAMVFPDHAKAITNSVESAMSRDLRSSVGRNLGTNEAARYIKANSDYANIYNKALNKQIANKLNKASSQATPELINSVVYSRNASDIARIWSSLDATGKDAMRAAYISKIADSVGESLPAKFLTQIDKLKKQAGGQVYQTVFGGRYAKELDAIQQVLKKTSRSDAANVVTQTGQALANPIRIGTGAATMGTSLAGEAGYGLMMRVYESKPVRNMLLRLANTKPGTPAHERILNETANAIRPILANQATQQD